MVVICNCVELNDAPQYAYPVITCLLWRASSGMIDLTLRQNLVSRLDINTAHVAFADFTFEHPLIRLCGMLMVLDNLTDRQTIHFTDRQLIYQYARYCVSSIRLYSKLMTMLV